MASQKIKKKADTSGPAGFLPRQAAVPCLVIIVLGFVAVSLLLFFSLRGGG